MKAKVLIYRFKTDLNQTTGVCIVLNEYNEPIFSSISLERGWQENKSRVSCIPEGEYNLVYEYSDRFKEKLWEIKGVPGRSECKFHSANYWNQLNGCIALGVSPKDINNDGYIDVTSSRNTLDKFEGVLNNFNKVELNIINKCD